MLGCLFWHCRSKQKNIKMQRRVEPSLLCCTGAQCLLAFHINTALFSVDHEGYQYCHGRTGVSSVPIQGRDYRMGGGLVGWVGGQRCCLCVDTSDIILPAVSPLYHSLCLHLQMFFVLTRPTRWWDVSLLERTAQLPFSRSVQVLSR